MLNIVTSQNQKNVDILFIGASIIENMIDTEVRLICLYAKMLTFYFLFRCGIIG